MENVLGHELKVVPMTHSVYRAVVRREGQNCWLSLAAKKGPLTFDLNEGEPAGTDIPVRLPNPIAAALGPLLERATATCSPPEDDMPAMLGAGDGAETCSVASLFHLCWPEFVEDQGRVFRLPPNGRLPSTSQAGDRTGAEAFVNHVHLNDLFRDAGGQCTNQLTKRQCFQVAEMWMTKLKILFPRRYFVMYLFMDGEDTHLRFHTLRTSEPLWTDLDLMYEDSSQSLAVWFF